MRASEGLDPDKHELVEAFGRGLRTYGSSERLVPDPQVRLGEVREGVDE